MSEEKATKEALLSAMFIDNFWDRFPAYGIPREQVKRLRAIPFVDRVGWISAWSTAAEDAYKEATSLYDIGDYERARAQFLLASLFWCAAQWIYLDATTEKRELYEKCRKASKRVNQLCNYQVDNVTLTVDSFEYKGIIRIPKNPIGVIVLINTIDTCKEETFVLADDFVQMGFATCCFDGPGQGEAFVLDGLRATKEKWDRFVKKQIEFAAGYARLSGLPVYLFGGSSGADWSLYHANHPLVTNVAVVSPNFNALRRFHNSPYFLRMRVTKISSVTHSRELPQKFPLPDVSETFDREGKPILIFHGAKDVLVPEQVFTEMFNAIPGPKTKVVFEEEGHLCYNRLNDVREMAANWFRKQDEEKNGHA